MLLVTPNHLRLLAALLWYSGGIVLFYKGCIMLLDADALFPDSPWFWYAIILGVSAGLLKVRFIFIKVCRKNLERIAALPQPRIWQFYRPGFFVFLLSMILLGSMLSRVAQGSYPFMIFMATLDFSLAVALLGSSPVFWAHRMYGQRPEE